MRACTYNWLGSAISRILKTCTLYWWFAQEWCEFNPKSEKTVLLKMLQARDQYGWFAHILLQQCLKYASACCILVHRCIGLRLGRVKHPASGMSLPRKTSTHCARLHHRLLDLPPRLPHRTLVWACCGGGRSLLSSSSSSSPSFSANLANLFEKFVRPMEALRPFFALLARTIFPVLLEFTH